MPGLSWVAPFGAVAALAVVIVVAGSSLLLAARQVPHGARAPGSHDHCPGARRSAADADPGGRG